MAALDSNSEVADALPVTVEELAKKAELPLECLDKVFRKEEACLLAEFCDQWELIGYYLQLAREDMNGIKDDCATTDLRRIEMLMRWRGKFAYGATYRVLIKALIQSKHADMALELCQRLKHKLAATSSTENEDIESQIRARLAEQRPVVCRDTPCVELIPIHQLQMQFVHVQNRFLQSGPGTGVTLQQLQTCISTLPSFITDTPQLLLEATSINLFSFNLKKYCSALNPDILEGLIEILGDTGTKSMMQKYNRHLHEFRCKIKLKDLIANYNGPTPPEYKEIKLKLKDNWREKTLTDLNVITSQIFWQSWLVKIIGGTTILYAIFMVPKEPDLELEVHLRDYLQSQHVLQILVDKVSVFDCEGGQQKRFDLNSGVGR